MNYKSSMDYTDLAWIDSDEPEPFRNEYEDLDLEDLYLGVIAEVEAGNLIQPDESHKSTDKSGVSALPFWSHVSTFYAHKNWQSLFLPFAHHLDAWRYEKISRDNAVARKADEQTYTPPVREFNRKITSVVPPVSNVIEFPKPVAVTPPKRHFTKQEYIDLVLAKQSAVCAEFKLENIFGVCVYDGWTYPNWIEFYVKEQGHVRLAVNYAKLFTLEDFLTDATKIERAARKYISSWASPIEAEAKIG